MDDKKIKSSHKDFVDVVSFTGDLQGVGRSGEVDIIAVPGVLLSHAGRL